MAQRGCDACPDIDAGPRHQIALANGGTAYYHPACVPQTAHDTSGLHPQAAQLVHAHEQAVGRDSDGNDLGQLGVMKAGGVEFGVEDLTVGGRPIAEVSAELFAAEKTPKK